MNSYYIEFVKCQFRLVSQLISSFFNKKRITTLMLFRIRRCYNENMQIKNKYTRLLISLITLSREKDFISC